VTSSRWVWLISALSGLRALIAWLVLDAVLIPDTALYAQGGLGLFPSPLGRALGAFGPVGLGVATVVASFFLPYLAARIARAAGGAPVLAAGIALLTPLALWSMFVGVDALGAALLLAALASHLEHRVRWAVAFAALAVLAHLAVLPLVLVLVLVLIRSWAYRIAALAALAVFAAGVLRLTAYGGNLAALREPASIVKVGILTLGIAFLPYLVALRRLLTASELRPLLVALALGTALAAGYVGAQERRTNARYALPLVVLLAAVVAVPNRARPRRVLA